MTTRTQLLQFFDGLLSPELFTDYGPNGLQIEGRAQVKKVAWAVSATRASVQQAVDWQADALVVHHGLFWNFHGVRPLVGPFAARVMPLVRAEINLFGYHLPLDAHMEVGNAAAIARRLAMTHTEPFGSYKGAPLGVSGRLAAGITARELASQLEQLLQHPVMLSSPDPSAQINSLGIITGGANRYWRAAAQAGIDAFLTGEMSEHDWHDAKEGGVHMFAGGHNATESIGICDLMAKTCETFAELECQYFPSENPA